MRVVYLKVNQTGATLILMAFIIALATTVYLLKTYDPAQLRLERDKKTHQALATAKQSLLAYAAQTITKSPNTLPPLNCNDNCPRPGDLPCPDKNNDGEAETTCNDQADRLGRLPWKTLGIDDLRDGSGERLWYAVSNQYKNNTRLPLLNSESLGTISSRVAAGNQVYDARNGSGLAAIIIAPGSPLNRADNIMQDRASLSGKFGNNVASNYLDTAFGEDNAGFIDFKLNDLTIDGFISGNIKVGEMVILNDIILPITRDEMNAIMEPRVLTEVMQAMLNNFCPNKADVKNRVCTEITIYDYFPDPAKVTDFTCLGSATIDNVDCNSNSGISFGRIPVGGNTSPVTNGGWEGQDFNSILQGKSSNNWFQQNGWREFIFYAVAPACTEPTKSCTGAGYLTLNNALTPIPAPTPNNKKIVLIAGGSALVGQSRTSSNKLIVSNYLEDENTLPLDNTYLRYIHNMNRNDRLISIP